jgi:phosphosulfolactate synthase
LFSIVRGHFERGLSKLKNAGFNYIELSEGVSDIPRNEKVIAMEYAKSNDMRFILEIGKKRKSEQLSLLETIEMINDATNYDPDIIIVEGREAGRDVEIYDTDGNIKWDWVEAIVDSCEIDRLMFEAPNERQQIELILRFGSRINFGNISFSSIAALASQRFGLRGDTFSNDRIVENLDGSPATKFVYHIIKNSVALDQAAIMKITGMSRRTIQNSIVELIGKSLIKERTDLRDLRRKVYSCRN